MQASATEIAPGKAIDLQLKFTGLPGRKSDLVRAVFRSNELGDPVITFDVHAKVKEEILLDSNNVTFDTLEKGQTKSLELTVRSADGKPFALQNVIGSHAEISYSPAKPPGDNSVYTVKATFKGSKGGLVSDAASVITDRQSGGDRDAVRFGNGQARSRLHSGNRQRGNRTARGWSRLSRRSSSAPVREGWKCWAVVDGAPPPKNLALDYVVDRIDEESCRLSIKLKDPYSTKKPFGFFAVKTNVEELDFNIPYHVNGTFNLQTTPKAPAQK